MDWITVLRSLQSDFIKRLTSGCLLHCQTEGQYSEITIISGERLKILREFCWQMAEKYKRVSPVRDVFISYLKGKLGEEVVKERLADLITEVDYEKRIGGDGKTDFTMTSNPGIGIEVKSRYGSIDKVRWSISAEEVEKNSAVVCVLIQEEVNEAQSEYHLFLAGFLPTQMIKLKTGRISFGIEQLLYGGGLRGYLENLQCSPNYQDKQTSNSESIYQVPHNSLTKSSLYSVKNAKISSPSKQLNLIYIKLGDECSEKGQYHAAIINYNQALQLYPYDADIYYKRGLTRYQLGDYEGAIADYTETIKINFNDADAYYNRGNARCCLGDKQGAIADFQKATSIYYTEGNLAKYKKVKESILDLEIEESLDILNF